MYSFCTSSGKRKLKTWQVGDTNYRKIPKISPGAYILQRPFWRGLFLEGPTLGGVYVRREIFVSKSIGLACSGKEICHFCFVLLSIRGQIPSTSPQGAYIRKGDLTEGFLCYKFGVLYLEGLIHGGAYFRNFTECQLQLSENKFPDATYIFRMNSPECQILINQSIKIRRKAWPTRDHGKKSQKRLPSLHVKAGWIFASEVSLKSKF